MEMNEATRNNRLLVTDPAIVVLMVEGSALNEIVKKVRSTVAAIDNANPDLAVAMWLRCQQHLKEASAGLQVANTELAQVRRSGIKLDPTHMDAAIEGLKTTEPALYPIGRFLAYTSVHIAYVAAKSQSRRPTMVMKSFLHGLEEHKLVLTRELNARLQQEVDRYVASGGDRPRGRCSVMTAENLGDDAYIVFEPSP